MDNVTLPSKLKIIGYSAFLNCKSISEIEIPVGVTTIGGVAFSGTSITDMSLPGTITSVGNDILSGCELESFNTGNGIENMGDALAGAKLKHLKIGAKVTYPDLFPITLESMELSPDNHNLRMDDTGALYDINTTILYADIFDSTERNNGIKVLHFEAKSSYLLYRLYFIRCHAIEHFLSRYLQNQIPGSFHCVLVPE